MQNETMHRTISDWNGFCEAWSGPRNFRMAGALADCAWVPPPLEQMIDELRRDEDVTIRSGARSNRLDYEAVPPGAFRKMPIEQAMETPFGLAHFDLGRFDAPGKCLDGFGQQVLDPWQAALSAAGFTWERCYPIAFVSGRGCATNYHMDFSHVMAWQIYGTKRFCGLRDPDAWAGHDARVRYAPADFEKPVAIREEDSLCYDMRPGERLWNVLLTPHWVEAGDEVAMSFNISHGGLRHRGALSPNERELMDWRAAHPEAATPRIGTDYRRNGAKHA